jgi:hypothetical protein
MRESTARVPHAKSMIGTWKLVSCEFRHEDGKVSYPLGADAVGWIAYEPDGRMWVQMMQLDRPRFSSDDFGGGDPEHKRAAYDGYIAYLGRYTVDESERAISHHIEACLFPNWIGTTQKRFFEITGNRLSLWSAPFTAQDGVVSAHILWERLE